MVLYKLFNNTIGRIAESYVNSINILYINIYMPDEILTEMITIRFGVYFTIQFGQCCKVLILLMSFQSIHFCHSGFIHTIEILNILVG